MIIYEVKYIVRAQIWFDSFNFFTIYKMIYYNIKDSLYVLTFPTLLSHI